MNVNIKVNENRSCSPSDIILGHVGEKNIDKIVLDIDKQIPEMRWYLNFDNRMYPFIGKEFSIDERITSEPGAFGAYIIGSDAKPGKSLTSGELFFNSNRIVMRVRDA